MKNIIISIILTIGLTILTGQSWQPVGNIHYDLTNQVKIAIGSQNTPYLASMSVSSNIITVKKISNGNWETIGQNSIIAPSTISSFDFAICETTPYVFYQTYNNASPALVKRFVNGEWETIGNLTTLPFGENPYYSLAVSSNNTPYIAYKLANGVSQIIIKRFIGEAWETLSGSGLDIDEDKFINLAIADSTVYLAYAEWTGQNSDYKITVKKFTDGVWETVGQPSFSTIISDKFSLAINDNGIPYVAYTDNTQNYKSTVMQFINEAWSVVGSPAFSEDQARMIKIDIANNGVPYVSFKDYLDTSLKTTVMRFINGEWETVGPPRFSIGMAGFIDVTIDGSNIPYVAYGDEALEFRVIVQKFTGELFEGNPRNGYLPLTVNFTSQAILTAPIVSWSWNFGDGSSSTLQNPQKTYSQPGQYSVSLTVVDQFGQTGSLTKTNYIQAIEAPPMAPANVSISRSGRNIALSWSPVTTNVVAGPINIEGYVVYHSPDPNDNFYYLGFAENTTFTHYRVTQFNQKNFYKVTTFVGDSSRLAGLIARNPNIKLGQLDKMLADEK